jgi:hypothetical protein
MPEENNINIEELLKALKDRVFWYPRNKHEIDLLVIAARQKKKDENAKDAK